MEWHKIIAIILHVFVLPLLVVYGFVVYVLIKHRKNELNGLFFHVCIALGFLDMYRAVTWLTFIMWPRYAFRDFYLMIGKPGYNINFWFANIATNYCTMASRVFNVILGINRMTAMAIPLRHGIIWAEMSKKTVVGGLLLSLTIHWSYIMVNWNGAYYRPVTANLTGLVTVAYKPTPLMYAIWAANNLIMAGLSVLIFVVVYSIAFTFARKHAKKDKSGHVGNARPQALFNKLDFKLAMAAFINAVVQMCMSGYFIIIYLYPQVIFDDIMLYYNRWDVITMIDCFITPLMLIAFSDVVREQCRLALCGNGNSVAPFHG